MTRTSQDWFIFEVWEIDDSTKAPTTEGYFIVAARDRQEASVVGAKASRHVTQVYAAHRLPADLTARHASEWPARLSEKRLAEIEANAPGVLEKREGEWRLARPTPDLQFNHFVFAKAALACLPPALLVAALRLAPADTASLVPARWTPGWLALLLVVVAIIVRIKIRNTDRRLPFWSIARPAILLFAAGLVLLAWPELDALLLSLKSSKSP